MENNFYKKSRSAIMVLAVVMVSLMGGNMIFAQSIDENYIEDLPVEGVTSGNLANSSYVAAKGDWLFFGDYCQEKLGFYKMKNDGSERQIFVKNEYPKYINIINDWLYYLGYDQKIYKILVDGRKRKNIYNGAKIIKVIGDWIYFVDLKSKNLMKIKNDGSEATLLLKTEVYSFDIVNGWIYYIDHLDGKKIKKIKTDGTNKSIVCNDQSTDLVIDGEWVYYKNWSENRVLSKIKVDGTQKTLFKINNFTCFNIYRNQIIFNNITLNEGGLYYIDNNDGEGITKKQIERGGSSIKSIIVIDDWLYYKKVMKKSRSKAFMDVLFRTKFDAAIIEKISF